MVQKILQVGQIFVITKWDNCFYKERQVVLLQSGTILLQSGTFLLQSGTGTIQSGTIIRKWSLTAKIKCVTAWWLWKHETQIYKK